MMSDCLLRYIYLRSITVCFYYTEKVNNLSIYSYIKYYNYVYYIIYMNKFFLIYFITIAICTHTKHRYIYCKKMQWIYMNLTILFIYLLYTYYNIIYYKTGFLISRSSSFIYLCKRKYNYINVTTIAKQQSPYYTFFFLMYYYVF